MTLHVYSCGNSWSITLHSLFIYSYWM